MSAHGSVVAPGERRAARIASDSEAIEAARALAVRGEAGAAARDRGRLAPTGELDDLGRSGLLGITVPDRLGGPEVSVATVTEVLRLLATADASVAQIPQGHFTFLDALRRQGTAAQQDRYFGEALAGRRFANAQVERTSRTVTDDATTLRRRDAGEPGYVLSGTKYYATGSLHADWLVVRAVAADEPAGADGTRPKVLVYVAASAPGIRIEDDWDGLGQRTTASGTVHLSDVAVDPQQVVPYADIFDHPTTFGARAQILHAAIDAGIARGALEAGRAAAERARPWFEAGVERAIDDPLLVQVAGELEVAVRGAEALLRDAAARIDEAEADPTDASTAEASIATAAAKVAAARASIEASSALFELGGARASVDALNLSRYWRDARTHTLHDPVRWKVQHIGRWTLSSTRPPRHGQI
ncbi:MAG: SfnB family sulfur acquisition oxidoreductase [Solirubrobacteraceae bacterium]|nr:SfnB family sulfur acquisition oxidoreductase [Solirubrobacteraceae bacterium]